MENNIGDRAISKAAEIGIKSQLDDVQELDVAIDANPLAIPQGKLDSVTIDGKEIVMAEDLKSQRMIVQTSEIKINPIKAALGEIELEQTTNAEAKLVLTEADLQRAFNSEFIQDKLKNQQLTLNGEQLTVNARNVNFSLPEAETLELKADIHILESNTCQPIALTAKAIADQDQNKIVLQDIKYHHQDDNHRALAAALIDSTQEILDLRNFELEGMSLQIQRLQIRNGKMTIAGKAVISDFDP